MAGNQVTLTFAGDEKPLTQSMQRVGGAARDMGQQVDEAGRGFHRAGEAADSMDTKAMGFRDTLTGLQDGFKGLKSILAGDIGFESLLMLGFGVGDLASGFANLLIPAMRSAVTWFRATRVGMIAAAAAQRVWTAAQWLFSASLWASPITWIIVGIVALIAVIVLIARRTDWFSRAWRASWGWIKRAASDTWDFIKRIPGWISSAFRGVANYIMAPFRAAFNGIARAWNATVGRLSWSVPSWVPMIGGRSLSVPNLPTYHAGGVLPGVRGTAVPFLGLAGERIMGPAAAASSSGGDEAWIRVDLGDLGDALIRSIARAMGPRGGHATHLGIRVDNGQVRA